MEQFYSPIANSFPFYEYTFKEGQFMSKKSNSPRTDWHKAIFCAVQIDLKEYADLLEYKREHSLSANKNCIDFLVIKKLSDFQIPKHIASIFRTHNIFEAKGKNSTLTKNAYYKTIGHAGYYIANYKTSNTIDRRDVTLTFPTFRYPRKLFKHLTKECDKTIENPFSGVYYILNETYITQVLVINELSPEDVLFLRCLSPKTNPILINKLAKDFEKNKNNKLYVDYMDQLFYSHKKGDELMVCEGLLNYFGTSSEELLEQGAERAKQFYLPQIEELIAKVNQLTSELEEIKKNSPQHNSAY